MDYLKAGHDFGVINRRSQAYVTEICRPWDLSYSEHILLMSLYTRNGCQQSELCKTIEADKALVARCVKTLEEKGFLCRRQSDQNEAGKIYLSDAESLVLTGTDGTFLEKVGRSAGAGY